MSEKNLTSGPVGTVLLKFAVPVILSMIATQLYSLVDSMIVGRMMGEKALAAVSNAANVMSFFMIISGGMELGGSLIVSSHSLKDSSENLQKQIWNLLVTDFLLAVIIFLFGLYGTKWMLMVTNTPAEIMDMAMLYGKIYLIGLPFMMLYDLSRSTLLGLGDSRTPMNMILITSVLNIVLDLTLVPSYGISGAAWATVISQMLGLLLNILWFRKKIIHIPFRISMLSLNCFKEICRLVPPYIVQQSALILLVLFRQSLLGGFGTFAIAGFSASSRMNGMFMIPIAGICQALTIFTSQNYSVHKQDRVQKGIRSAYLYFLIYISCTYVICILFRKQLMNLFTNDPETIAYGAIMIMAWPFYTTLFGSQNLQEAVLRGYQKMTLYMFSSVSVSVCIIFLSLLFVSKFGYYGFWIANLVSYAYGAVISALLVRKVSKK